MANKREASVAGTCSFRVQRQAARVLVAAKRSRAARGGLAGEGRRDPRAAVSRSGRIGVRRLPAGTGQPRPGRGHDARRQTVPARASPAAKGRRGEGRLRRARRCPADPQRDGQGPEADRRRQDEFSRHRDGPRRRSGVERREDLGDRLHGRRQAVSCSRQGCRDHSLADRAERQDLCGANRRFTACPATPRGPATSRPPCRNFLDNGETSFEVAQHGRRRRSGVQGREDADGAIHRRRQAAQGQRRGSRNHRVGARCDCQRETSGHAYRRRRRQRAAGSLAERPFRAHHGVGPQAGRHGRRSFRPRRRWPVRGN